MFKKLLSFLFDEEVLEDENESLEEEIESLTKPLEISQPQKSVVLIDIDEPIKHEPTVLDLQESIQPQPISEKPVTKTEKTEKPTIAKTVKATTEYEFSKVISPIFGYKHQPEVTIQVQPKLKVETESSVLGTIISPIYGAKKSKSQTPTPTIKPTTSNHLTIEDVLGLHKQQELKQSELEIFEPSTKQSSLLENQPLETDINQEPLDYSWEEINNIEDEQTNKTDVLLKLFEEEVE